MLIVTSLVFVNRRDRILELSLNCLIYSCGRSCRIGTEHEKFGFEIGSLRPMKYDQIAELLNGIAERFDWDKVMEGDKIIGLKQVSLTFASTTCLIFSSSLIHLLKLQRYVNQGKQSISLEPGGQFELSGAPLETLHQTCAEVNLHLYQVLVSLIH